MREATVRGRVTKKAIPTLVTPLALAVICQVVGTGCSNARQGAATQHVITAPEPEPIARPTRLVADEFDIALLRADGTLALWSLGTARISPEREPVDALVDAWQGLGVLRGNLLTRLTRADEEGCLPQRVRLPERSVAAVWHRGLYVLSADGALLFAALDEWPEDELDDDARRGFCPATPETIAPEFARVQGLRPVREILQVRDSLCGRDELGDVFCLGDSNPTPGARARVPNAEGHARFPLPRRAVALAGANPGLCVLDAGGSIHCMRPADPASRETLAGGPYRRMAAARQHVCGQMASGAVRCFRFPRMSDGYCHPGDCERSESTTSLPVGAHLVVTSDDVCTTTRDGDLVCSCLCHARRWPACDPRPREVPSLHPVQAEDDALVDYDASSALRCALSRSSGMRCWTPGGDRRGRPTWTAQTIAGPAAPDAMEHVIVNERDLCVVLADRSMHCTSVGALGHPEWQSVARNVRDWQSGRTFVCVQNDEQHVRCRGSITFESGHAALSLDPREPIPLGGSPARVDQLSAGSEHVCVRLTDGRVACVGDGGSGQLALGAAHLESATLRVVPGLGDALTIATAGNTTLAQSATTLHWWGDRRAYHPVPIDQPPGRVTHLPLLGGGDFCVRGSEWRCGSELVRFLPWAERPHVTLTADGELPGRLVWSRGRARHMCQPESSISGVTHCYSDEDPGRSTARLGPDAGVDSYSLPATPDDVPRFPLRTVDHARIYRVSGGIGSRGEPGCENTLVSRPHGWVDAPCPDLAQRGRALAAGDLETLLHGINDVAAYERAATCFLPHHEIIFFDAQDQPVGRLVVCLTCGTMEGVPAIPAQVAAGGNVWPRGLDLEGICQRAGLDDCVRSH